MNAVADWLFSFLLGWTGNVFNGAMRSLSSNAAGLTSFFSVIWLPLLLVLIAAGVAIDYIVWFIRWRPHYLWRSRALRRLAQKQQAGVAPAAEQADMPDQYRDQIAQWVAVDEPPLPELWENAPLPPEASDEAVEQPPLFSSDTYDPAFYMPSQPDAQQSWTQYEPEQPPLRSYDEAAPLPLAEDAQPFLPDTEAPLFTPEMQQLYDAYPELLTDETPAPAARKRRSGRHQQVGSKLRRPSLGGLLHQLTPEDEGVLEGLPPPVPQEKAFRRPVYPDSYPYRQNEPPH